MADNLTAKDASGATRTIMADDVGGSGSELLAEVVKVAFGADGTATPVSPSNPLPIAAPATLPLPAGAATDAKVEAVRALLAAALTVNVAQLPAGVATAAGQAAIVTALAALLKVDTVARGSAVDRSGTITTGGTAQQLIAANANRRGFMLQNLSSKQLWWKPVSSASPSPASAGPGSFFVLAGGSYVTEPTFCTTDPISIFGTDAGLSFSALEY